MNIGLIIEDSDVFFRPVEAALRRRHHLECFDPRFIRMPLIGERVNRWLLDRQLQQFLTRNDVVFFEWAGPVLLKASKLARFGRIVTRLHSFELTTTAKLVDWSKVDALILLNETLHSRLRTIVDQPLPPVTVVANGVDLDLYQYVHHPFAYRLGMVCSLLPIKRIYEIVLCVYQLRQDGHPFTLHIAGTAGSGDALRYKWALESLVKKLELDDAIRFYGHIDRVWDWLREIDVFISNSYWEGQQVALIEAMAAGRHCLSHFWDGVQEMLPDENIFTTDSDLRSKLLAYAQYDETEKAQAQARLRAVAEERFDERRMVSQIIEVVETLGLR